MTLDSHQRTIGATQMHLTPRSIIDALGPFDLDPCRESAPMGLRCRKHHGRVKWAQSAMAGPRAWLNPPFDRGAFIDNWHLYSGATLFKTAAE
jgi:hypothetical protein